MLDSVETYSNPARNFCYYNQEMALEISFRSMGRTLRQSNRIPIYCALIPMCSLIDLPEDYKIDKRNLLNLWFVKIGWFWTIALLVPFLFTSIKIDDRETVSQAILRLLASTILWYTSVNLFQAIDSATGFDISGHTFLLMFSNLIITSELKLIRARTKKEIKFSYQSALGGGKSQTSAIRLLLVLTILWDFMLVQTALYYHSMVQKVIAALWAIGSWYLMQKFFYLEPRSESIERGRGER